AGEKASLAAVKAAIESPLLKGIKGARAILMNIVGSSSSIGGMVEVDEATTAIQELAHPDAEIIWGVTTDEAIGEKVSVIVIATKLVEDSDEVEV
ncbi:MAG: cell division protein FtsZ, partial [Candidatus Cryptobacteroides sp.]|nr:cell division protein FtsZ [Candidatus Cryptobacteroides sp.]